MLLCKQAAPRLYIIDESIIELIAKFERLLRLVTSVDINVVATTGRYANSSFFGVAATLAFGYP